MAVLDTKTTSMMEEDPGGTRNVMSLICTVEITTRTRGRTQNIYETKKGFSAIEFLLVRIV